MTYDRRARIEALRAREKQVAKTEKRLAVFAIGAWLLYVLFYLACVAGIVYVAWHFISKYW